MFRKILVAVDGSDMTGKVLAAAADVSRHYSSDLHLGYVSERGWTGGVTGRELVVGELPEAERTLVSGFAQELEARGVRAIMHLRQGHPGEVIISLADELGADLVVLGSVGMSRISRMLSGSVSTFVVTHSRVATLVIK
ncbi:MAG: universal stress protein, partial [Methanoregulaceae archaeon]|nr:universal stress protein [Methanoregulaceae archaeon]